MKIRIFVTLMVLALFCVGGVYADDVEDTLLKSGLNILMGPATMSSEVEGSAAPVTVVPIGAVVTNGNSAIMLVQAYKGTPVMKAKCAVAGTYNSFSYYGGGVYYTMLSHNKAVRLYRKYLKGKRLLKGWVKGKYATKTTGYYILAAP